MSQYQLPRGKKFYNIGAWMPMFLRVGYFGAFIEGWGLYAEFLGNELKVFEEDPTQWIGFYSMNLLRAAR